MDQRKRTNTNKLKGGDMSLAIWQQDAISMSLTLRWTILSMGTPSAPSSSCLKGLGVEATKILGIVAVVILVDIVVVVDVVCVLIFIVSIFWCSCCFSLKGCVSQVFSNDDILNMQEWMAVCSITIKGALGWDDMTHTTHSTTQTFRHQKNPSLLVTHQNFYIRSLQPSIYPKHHKYGRQSLAHSKSHHSPHVCHFYVLFPISP